jgi:hypothetical protein
MARTVMCKRRKHRRYTSLDQRTDNSRLYLFMLYIAHPTVVDHSITGWMRL